MHNKISYFGDLIIISLISIPTLFFIPFEGYDLFNYYKEMSLISGYKSIRLLLIGYKQIPALEYHRYDYLYDLYEWVISKTGMYSLLPFITLLGVYICFTIPVIHERLKYNLSLINTIFVICVMIFLLPYLDMSSTLRWSIALGFSAFVTYLYCNSKTRYERLLTFLFYLPIYFIHRGIVLVVILVLLGTFIHKIKRRHIIEFVVLFLLLVFYVIPLGAKFSPNSIFHIANGYLYMPNQFADGIKGALLSFLPAASPIFYSIGDIFMLKFNDINYNKSNLSLIKRLFVLFNIIILCLSPQLIVFSRYAGPTAVIDMILFLELKRYHAKVPLITIMCYGVGLFISISVFLASLTEMDFNF